MRRPVGPASISNNDLQPQSAGCVVCLMQEILRRRAGYNPPSTVLWAFEKSKFCLMPAPLNYSYASYDDLP